MVDFTQAESRLLKDPTIQFRFPEAPTAVTPAVPHGPGFGWWGWVPPGNWLFWGVVTVAVVLLLAVIVQAARNGRLPGRTQSPGVAQAGDPLPAAASVALLADADALAGRGDYAGAVHALLLRGVGAIHRGFPHILAPSHTSRDIAALPALPSRVRDAFAVIALRTEHAVFGQRPLGQADWEECRATYAGLLSAAGWKRPS